MPCIGRESNQGLPHGRRDFYHWPTNACIEEHFVSQNRPDTNVQLQDSKSLLTSRNAGTPQLLISTVVSIPWSCVKPGMWRFLPLFSLNVKRQFVLVTQMIQHYNFARLSRGRPGFNSPTGRQVLKLPNTYNLPYFKKHEASVSKGGFLISVTSVTKLNRRSTLAQLLHCVRMAERSKALRSGRTCEHHLCSISLTV